MSWWWWWRALLGEKSRARIAGPENVINLAPGYSRAYIAMGRRVPAVCAAAGLSTGFLITAGKTASSLLHAAVSGTRLRPEEAVPGISRASSASLGVWCSASVQPQRRRSGFHIATSGHRSRRAGGRVLLLSPSNDAVSMEAVAATSRDGSCDETMTGCTSIT